MAKAKDTSKASGVVIPNDKNEAALRVVSELTTKFGSGSFVRLGDKPQLSMDVISTGIYQLDHWVLGCGGFPRGRMVEIYGPESASKTTLALTVAAQSQRLGGKVCIVDTEHSLDPSWAETLGVNTDDMYISQPDYGEQALTIVDDVIRSGAFDVVILDSAAATVPLGEIQGEYGSANMGSQARLFSQAMRKMTGIVNQSKTVFIITNQIRSKIGVIYGSPDVTCCGNALKFYASIRLDLRRKEYLKVQEDSPPYGNVVKIKAIKNKTAPPFREAEVNLLYECGFDKASSLLDAAVASNVVQKAGSWYSFEGQRLGQGKDAVSTLLRGDDEFYRKIYSAIRSKDKELNSI